MPGYLYYIPVPVVVEEPLTPYQRKALPKALQNNLTAVVLDDEIEVVYDEMEDIRIHPAHVHESDQDNGVNCTACIRICQDDMHVEKPVEE